MTEYLLGQETLCWPQGGSCNHSQGQGTRASMTTPLKNERWSAQMLRIGNQAVRQAQARNRQLGIPNWYSLNGRLVSDVAEPAVPARGEKPEPQRKTAG